MRTFFKRFLRHSKGDFAGKPFELLPWQWDDIIKPLFGWQNKKDLRRYRTGYIEVPKKNGKSTLLSGICLYMLMADGEPGAEVYCCAADKQQAEIIFNEAKNMVNASPALFKHLEVLRDRIVYKKTNSFFRVLSSEVKSKDGYNSNAIIFDELSAQDTPRLWDILRYAGAARRQPMLLSITTAGYNKETICYEQHRYAKSILDGSKNDVTFFPYIKAAPDDADWTDPEVHKAANPSYGITIPAADFKAACIEAQNEPRKENSFRRLRLNQWVGNSNQWLSTKMWEACNQDFKESDFYGNECYVGIDLARKHDLAAVVYLFPQEDRFCVIPRFFIPKDLALKKEHSDKVPYLLWERNGFVEFTKGNTIDQMAIRSRINADAKNFKFIEIGYDPYNAEILCNQFLSGEDGFPVVEVAQTINGIGKATSHLERLVLEQRLRHNSQPVLNWNATNAVVKALNDGRIIISKGMSTARIDGIAATIIALSRAMIGEDNTSIYNQRGLLEL